jgi:MGT family glycosyltransferase
LRILAVTFDGAGNLPPERSLFRALMARGHNVTVLAHDTQRAAIEADGAAFLPFAHAAQRCAIAPTSIAEEPTVLFEHVIFSEAIGRDAADAIKTYRPHTLLIDYFLVCALLAGRASRLPVIPLCHSIYVCERLFGAPYAQRMERLRGFAASLGASVASSFDALIAEAPCALVFSYPALNPALDDLPPSLLHVGPLRQAPAGIALRERRYPDRPLVLASLSTSFQDQLRVLRTIATALGALPVEGVMTTGPAIAPQDIRAPENVEVIAFAPHEAILPTADLLITHAGHGTVLAGMEFGVPMLCLPMGRDQPLVAKCAASLGVAHVAAPDTPDLRAAIEAALADRGMREKAAAFARSIRGFGGEAAAVAAVEAAAHGRPRRAAPANTTP